MLPGRHGHGRVAVPSRGDHRGTAPSRPLPSLPFQMDPVQKAVISHTFGVPAPLKKKQFISCNICHLRFNSAVSGAGWAAGCAGPVSVPAPGAEQGHPTTGTLVAQATAPRSSARPGSAAAPR